MIANDTRGLINMAENGKLISLKNGTKLLVIERIDNRFIADGNRGLVVRVLDGPFSNSKVWMLEEHVERVINRVLVNNSAYFMVEGDQIEVIEDTVPATDSWAALDEFAKQRKANKTDTKEKLLESAIKNPGVILLTRRTKLVVLKVYEPLRKTAQSKAAVLGDTVKGLAEFTASHPAGLAVEVKVLTGPHAGKLVFLSKRHAGRFIDQTPGVLVGRSTAKTKAKPVPKASAGSVPETKAAKTAWELGKNVRFEGNRDAAIEHFRRAIKEAPGVNRRERSSRNPESNGRQVKITDSIVVVICLA